MRLHSSLRGAERRRGLRDREIQIKPQHDYLTLAIRQTTNRPAHHVALRKPLALIDVDISTIIGSKPLADTPTLAAPTVTRQIHEHPVRVRVRRLSRQNVSWSRSSACPRSPHNKNALRSNDGAARRANASNSPRSPSPLNQSLQPTTLITPTAQARLSRPNNFFQPLKCPAQPLAQILFSEPAQPRRRVAASTALPAEPGALPAARLAC